MCDTVFMFIISMLVALIYSNTEDGTVLGTKIAVVSKTKNLSSQRTYIILT